jgi:hypothetical protein
LQFQAAHPAALLETESGCHLFAREIGKSESCFVETQAGMLMQYRPPADCGRAGSFGDLQKRRIYDPPRELCYDYALEKELRIRGRSIDEVVAQATADYLTKRIWSLLD